MRQPTEEKRTELASIEQLVAENDAVQKEMRDKERRSKLLSDDVTKRIVHSQILYENRDAKSRKFAQVKSPLGEQSSQAFRLLGESEPLAMSAEEDPRGKVVEWLRRPDNPYFAKAIVNRVWAHYFGRGIVHPPDDLSPYNPATHPALLDELCRGFIENRYDLKWLHRTILASRTYQQASQPASEAAGDRTNYTHFYLRRLPAEVLVDVLNQATPTREDFDMKYFHWAEGLSVGRSSLHAAQPVRHVRAGAIRPPGAQLLGAVRLRPPGGRLAVAGADAGQPSARLAEDRRPGRPRGGDHQANVRSARADRRTLPEHTFSPAQRSRAAACQEHAGQAESPEKGLQAVLWSLLNTREFLLQH